MTVALRENNNDKTNQKRLFEVFSKHFNAQYNEFSSNSKKYRIDGYLYRNNIPITWVECKWYSNKAHLYLNIPKYRQLIELSEITGIHSCLLIHEKGKIRYVILHDGKKRNVRCQTIIGGGTPKGRKPNPDDIEPLVKFAGNDINWI